MSQYRYSDGESPLWEAPVTLEATTGGTVNFTISLAALADLDELWGNIQSNGYDLRILQSDGRTLITSTSWDILSFNATTRTGTVRVQGYAAQTGMSLLWMVWGKPSADATSAWVGTPSPTSPKTTHVHRGDPLRVDAARVFRGAARGQGRATKPRGELRKGSSEVIRVYFLVDGLVRSRQFVAQGSERWDLPLYGTHDVVDENGSDVATMYTATDGRFALDSDGRLYYSMLVKAGTNGSKYTARCTLVTNEGETVQYTGGIVVQNVLAS